MEWEAQTHSLTPLAQEEAFHHSQKGRGLAEQGTRRSWGAHTHTWCRSPAATSDSSPPWPPGAAQSRQGGALISSFWEASMLPSALFCLHSHRHSTHRCRLEHQMQQPGVIYIAATGRSAFYRQNLALKTFQSKGEIHCFPGFSSQPKHSCSHGTPAQPMCRLQLINPVVAGLK
ncbi:hypothetical protein KIL84_012212 [Mauremys mutica]|uniref:Uncharacterized protein n=1 Tax=Mauremys mutica TaxID=74926 RepID=A0A9D3XG38_9SAUR|nr:hypothetical protein KIL84_012212 [Mauremys mutica]